LGRQYPNDVRPEIPNNLRTSPVALRHWLRERIDAIQTGEAAHTPTIATGWRTVDKALPGGGLRRGMIHEWFGIEASTPDTSENAPSARREWIPPLLILAHLADRATTINGQAERGWCVWIGARIWPAPHAIANALPRTLLVDPSTAADRLWAIDACLRCPGLVVIADGSALDTAATRRLQLAAESAGAISIIARPPHEIGCLSAAATRWRVAHATTGHADGAQRWKVKLFRCKGVASTVTHGSSVVLERNDVGAVVDVSPDVGERSGYASIAS